MEADGARQGRTARVDEAHEAHEVDEVDEVHEARCLRCGLCCYAKLLLQVGAGEDRVVYTNIPCRYLDLQTNLCKVYNRRHELNPDCLDVEVGTRRGVFPADCPYVKGLPGYRPPVVGLGAGGLQELLETLEAEEVET